MEVKILARIKEFIIRLFIGRYFTELEVKKVLSKMQFDMAQNIISSTRGKPIIPLNYWRENNGKYDTNLYDLK